jgi:hypothetical protein
VPEYEVYVQVFYIQEWRDDSVFKTEPGDCRWMSKDVVDENRPRLTNIIYASANDEFAKNNMTIRVKKDGN